MFDLELGREKTVGGGARVCLKNAHVIHTLRVKMFILYDPVFMGTKNVPFLFQETSYKNDQLCCINQG